MDWLDILRAGMVKHADPTEKVTVIGPKGEPLKLSKEFMERSKAKKPNVTVSLPGSPKPPKAPEVKVPEGPKFPSRPGSGTGMPKWESVRAPEIKAPAMKSTMPKVPASLPELRLGNKPVSLLAHEERQALSRAGGGTRNLAEAAGKSGFGKRMLLGGAAAAGLYGGFHLIRKIREKSQARNNFSNMMKETPALHHEDPKIVKTRFRTLQSVAPNLASDPLVAGSIVRQWTEYPTVNATALKDVVSVEKDVRRELGLIGALPRLISAVP